MPQGLLCIHDLSDDALHPAYLEGWGCLMLWATISTRSQHQALTSCSHAHVATYVNCPIQSKLPTQVYQLPTPGSRPHFLAAAGRSWASNLRFWHPERLPHTESQRTPAIDISPGVPCRNTCCFYILWLHSCRPWQCSFQKQHVVSE